jgi:hypothetical protein
MITINQYDYMSCYFKSRNLYREVDWDNHRCENKIYIDEDLLWITSNVKEKGSDGYEASVAISFNVTPDFVQELKALVFYIENIQDGE